MLSVTTAAVDHLNTMLDEVEASETEALRLVHQGGGKLGLTVDVQRDGDQAEPEKGRTVLLVDDELAAALDGSTLDSVDGPEGRRLTLVGPTPPEDESATAR